MSLGETADKSPAAADDVDVSIDRGDARTSAHFAARVVAAGGFAALAPQFRELAGLIGAHVGRPEAKAAWPRGTTYLDLHRGVERVISPHDPIAYRHSAASPIVNSPDFHTAFYTRASPLQDGVAQDMTKRR